MSKKPTRFRSKANASAIVASAAVATLVAVVCSSVLGVSGWPPHFVPRLGVLGNAGGSWGAPWESLARTPMQYQQDALAAVLKTVIRLGVASELIAALSLILHTVSRILARWRSLAIRSALGATMRHLLPLVLKELLLQGAIGCGAGLVLGGAIDLLLSSSWPSLFTRAPLVLPALVAGSASFLATAALIGGIATLLILILQKGVRSVAELHGNQVTAGSALMMVQTALATIQIAGLLIVTYGCQLILEQSSDSLAIASTAVGDSTRVAPLRWSTTGGTAQRASRERLLLAASRADTGMAMLSSADAWIGMGKEIPLMAFCGDCYVMGILKPLSAATVRMIAVAPGALRAGRYRVVGRDFSPQDTIGAQHVAIVNQAAESALFPGARALGRSVQTRFDTPDEYKVVGTAAFDAPPVFGNTGREPVVFVSLLQHSPELPEAGARPNVWDSLRAVVAGIKTDAPQLGDANLLADRMNEFIAPISWFSTLFSGLAASATGIGAYSLMAVMTQIVALREREIAIRMAVGATSRQIAGWVIGRTVWITVAGMAIGVSGARWIGTVLHGIEHSRDADVFQLMWMMLLFGGMGLLASLMPALRASKIEPAKVWASIT